ncbi:MAG: M20/M25/M40 family metallo-hydrolase [Flavisolibacter sp.]
MKKIRDEGLNHSQVMDIAHYLTDVSGPRLTNSPGYISASNWAVKELKSWGVLNAHLDSWGKFGPGWSMQKCYVAMKEPYYHPLIAYPYAWTKGTGKLISAPVVEISTLDADSIKKHDYNFKGKIVLVKTEDRIPSPFKKFAERYSDSALSNLNDMYMIAPAMTSIIKNYIKHLVNAVKEIQNRGAAALIETNIGDRDGTIEADKWWGKKYPDITGMYIAPEDYLRIQRLIKSNIPVQLELEIETAFNNEDENGYNVIAEIPGTDPVLKDEVVMIGGHLDSWYSATGATDNGAGSAVMMEVMRILKTLDVHPRRTVRLALWSGEEQGLFGSYGYVKKYFGDPTTMKLLPAQKKISAYYNLDNGTGKIRGIFTQNNDSVVAIFSQWIEPFRDLGVTTVTRKNTGSTDHISFDAVGIPGFEFIQDPIEYETRTHHTNMDTYEHLMPEDLKQAATVIAAFVYNTAMRKDMIPRKTLPKAGPWVFDLF